jgi:hypothetical protein
VLKQSSIIEKKYVEFIYMNLYNKLFPLWFRGLWVGVWWERALFIEQSIFPLDIAPRDVENRITAPLRHIVRGEK